MTNLKNIDHARSITFSPTIETTIDVPSIIELAQRLNDSNLLRCDEPIVGRQITLMEDESGRFLAWLALSRWGALVANELQCMAATAAGEPLLSAALDLEVFAALACDATEAQVLPALDDTLKRWREINVKHVYLDGYRSAVEH